MAHLQTEQPLAALVVTKKHTGFLNSISLRVVLAVVAVAFVSLGLLVWLTLHFASLDVSNLTSDQQDAVTSAVAKTLAVTFHDKEEQSPAAFAPAVSLVSGLDAEIVIRSATGTTILDAAPHTKSGPFGEPRTSSIMVNGELQGFVTLRFAPGSIGSADARLRSALQSAVAGSAAILAVLALIAGLLTSRRITKPIGALTEATRAMAAGNRTGQIADTKVPGELGELAAAFNKLADGLAREDTLRRALVADVAHELRTPLAVLQASVEALSDGIITASPQVFASLLDETNRLTHMVEDVEMLAAVEAAALDFRPLPVDLASIAASAAQAMSGQFAARHLTLTENLTPVLVLGDSTRIRQIITNLLGNAVKFTPEGEKVELIVGVSDENLAQLVVRDHGVGIANDEIDHVFERFWRGPNTTKVSGNGIGLAIVAEIARAHGGTATVTSVVGVGSQFVVRLPRSP